MVSSDVEICGTSEEMFKRQLFIRKITGFEPSAWRSFCVSDMCKPFWWCKTTDGINGVYITAHNYDVFMLCGFKCIYNMEFVVANTCEFGQDTDTRLLETLRKHNAEAELWFAFQEVELVEDGVIRNTNTLSNCGTFGFLTSKSDRLIYRNRKKGFIDALRTSFYRVSGVYCVRSFYGGI